MGFTPSQLALVDAQLSNAKTALLVCRQRYGVRDDVTFSLRYAASGLLDSVTVQQGPATMPPDFIHSAIIAIRGTVAFPYSGEPGVMAFTDLGPDSLVNARAANAAQDQLAQLRAPKKGNPATAVVVGIVAVFVIAAISAGGKERKANASASTPPPQVQEHQDEIISITADNLQREFAVDAAGADKSHRGRVMRVTGAVQGIKTDSSGVPSLLIWTTDRSHGVHATFETAALFAGVSIGQHVKVRCIGSTPIAASPVLRGCALE